MLLVLSMGSQALTLGRARGVAIVAQPLSLSVSISAAADEEVNDICFEADVFYGENKVDVSRVALSADAPSAGQTWQVRITSRLPVDEPVVTVYLRSTCSAKTSRRYVFLADVAPDVLPVLPHLNATAAGAFTSPVKAGQVDAIASASADKNTISGPSGDKSTRYRQIPGGMAKPVSAATPTTKPGKAAKARLKLAPLDLSVERDPALKSSLELSTTPTEDAQKRGEAAALWRALNLTPEDVMRDAARLQGLEKNVQKLAESSGSNQRQIQELLGRLERAEGERYWNPVVLGLGALLILMGAAGVLLFIRQRNQPNGSPWWRPDSGKDAGFDSAYGEAPVGTALSVAADDVSASAAGGTTKSNQTNASEGAAGVDIELDFDVQASVSSATAAQRADEGLVTTSALVANQARSPDFGHSAPGSLREVNTQELLDIRQQAEFFMTLGQYDNAISALKGHVADAADFNPLVHLDLLKIFHSLSRKEEFDRYRSEFNAVFTGQVPQYNDFLQVEPGLEAYPALSNRLVNLWPSREALEFLESCMVRHSGASANTILSLEAFKELLMLHAVGSRLVNALEGMPAAFSASKTATPEQSVFHTGPSPISATLPVGDLPALEVDLELDMPDLLTPASGKVADNLIDFDMFTPESIKVSDRR